MFRPFKVYAAFLAFVSLAVLPLRAGFETDAVVMKSQPETSGYEFAFVIPGWLAGVEGTTTVRGIEADFDAGIDKILRNLDMIATGGFEVRKGKTGFSFSGLYVDASVGGSTPGPLLSSFSVGIEQVLLEGTFAHRVYQNDRGWIDLLAGARYSSMATELSLFDGPGSLVEASVSWLDPCIGFQGHYEMSNKFFAVARGDAGGFGVGSELTWNLYGAIGTRVSESITMEVGYRYLYTDYGSGAFQYDAAMKGVFIGTRIAF